MAVQRTVSLTEDGMGLSVSGSATDIHPDISSRLCSLHSSYRIRKKMLGKEIFLIMKYF